ncbi:hypothetical protein [Synechococcus phage S-H25]|nr:hypothetical protein [Synechococcus phage S-H25]
MIKEAIKSIKEIFIPKSEFIEEEVQCAIDDDVVDCTDFKEPYIGVPAPDYLPEDPWFPAPVLSEKQISVKEAHEQAIADNQILADESGSVVESSDIHQKMYKIATKGSATTLQLDPPGGSENFHEGPGGWNSGTGLRQFH